MRILLLTQYFPPEAGAAQTRLAAMSRELKRKGHEVEIITCFPNYPLGKVFAGYRGFSVTEEWEGSTVRRYWVYAAQGRTLKRLANYLSFAFTACFGVFRAKKPDLIFVNSGPLFVSIPGALAALWWRAPMVLNVSDLWPRSVEHLEGLGGKIFLVFATALETWAYKRAKFLNAVSDGVKKFLIEEKRVPSEKILFLPNGVDTRLYAPRAADEELRRKLGLDGKFVFVYPGNHGYAHALHHVLEAAARLQKTGSDVAFLLIGGGSEKPRLLELAAKLELKNVVFVDPVSPDELPRYLSLASAGLVHLRNSPLAEETRPAKMFPLMSQALPILYSGFGEGADLLRKSDGGVVVPPESPDDLIRGIAELRAGDLKGMGARNRDFVVRDLSWELNVSRWLAELESRR